MRIIIRNETQSEVASAPAVIIRPLRGWSPIDFSELWQYPELFSPLTWREIKIRYKQTALGFARVILKPMLVKVIFTLFFGSLAKVLSEGISYPFFGRPPGTEKQLVLKPGTAWRFATQYQKVFYTSFAIMPQLLLKEFCVLHNRLDIAKWREKASTGETILLSYASSV